MLAATVAARAISCQKTGVCWLQDGNFPLGSGTALRRQNPSRAAKWCNMPHIRSLGSPQPPRKLPFYSCYDHGVSNRSWHIPKGKKTIATDRNARPTGKQRP